MITRKELRALRDEIAALRDQLAGLSLQLAHAGSPPQWLEARLKIGTGIREFYDSLGGQPAGSHHFWDEPWWPGGWVVRLPDSHDISDCPHVDHVVAWDASSDEAQFGKGWPAVQEFFTAGSRLGAPVNELTAAQREWFMRKMIHCFLNAQGMSHRDEVDFLDDFVRDFRERIEGTGPSAFAKPAYQPLPLDD